MKRAILVSAGTIAGLAAVLSYQSKPADMIVADPGVSSTPDPVASTPEPVVSDTPTTEPTETTSPTVTPSATSKPSPTTSATTAAPKPSVSKTSAAPTPAVTPSKTPSKTPTPTPKPSTPTPTPSKTASGWYTGSDIAEPTHYNPTGPIQHVQVKIFIQNGKITQVEALRMPNADSQAYTDFAKPQLVSATVGQSKASGIANATGATNTTKMWRKSVQAALTSAGL
jgi:uncharacterized protein with FMN-binding domain